MPTQTGTIDLRSANAVRLYAEQGFSTLDQTYATDSELELKADQIAATVRKEIYEVDPDTGEPTDTARWTTAIEASAGEILSSVSRDYATTEALENEASARSTAIAQSESGILASISETYATKDEARLELETLVRAYNDGVLVCKSGNALGALVSADGSFDVVTVSWADGVPTANTSSPLTQIAGDVATFGNKSGTHVAIETVTIEDASGGSTTTKQLGFYDGEDLVAYMRNGLFYVANTMVLHSMRVGEDDPDTKDVTEGWEWKYQSEGSATGNLTLRWVG